jgi:hypothetical protein
MFRCRKCHATGMDVTKQGTATVLLCELKGLQAERPQRYSIKGLNAYVLRICTVIYIHHLLGNDSVNIFPRKHTRNNRTSIATQRIIKLAFSTIERFSVWSVPRDYKGTKKRQGSAYLLVIVKYCLQLFINLRAVPGTTLTSLNS